MNITKVKFSDPIIQEHCKAVVQHNIVTVAQLAFLAKCSIATVEGKIRPYNTKKERCTLTTVYPFASPISQGPKFVLWNTECERFIAAALK